MIWIALASAASFEPVITELSTNAHIDWSSMSLVVEASSVRRGSEGTKAVEELARRLVDQRILPAAEQIPVAPADKLVDLRSSPELWPALEPRIGRWVETENRYYSSGKVTVVGSLRLSELLKPMVMATATSRSGPRSEYTGIVLDARGVEGIAPCFAPEIRGPSATLIDGRMWLDAAIERSPAALVSDAAHPAADRAGSNPLAAAIVAGKGCVLTVEAATEAKLSPLLETQLGGEGRLVIVVDP